MLAATLMPLWRQAGADVVGWTRAELDVTDAAAVRAALADAAPDVVVHAAAWTDVDAAEGQPEAVMRINAGGTGNVAAACAARGSILMLVSTDYVFDGVPPAPIGPGETPAPAGAYGRSKAAAEAAMAQAGADGLLLRTGWLYGPGGENFVDALAERARAGLPSRVVDDQHGAPTSARLFAEVAWRLLLAEKRGAWHVAASGETTWHGVAQAVYRAVGADPDLVRACTSEALGRPARRPAWSVLDCRATERELGVPLPDWEPQVGAYVTGGVLPECGLVAVAA